MTSTRVDEVEPLLALPTQSPPVIGIIAMITEPDGTDRSSRITLPADSADAALVHGLREVSISAARLRGVPAEVADWYAACPVNFAQATALLRDWVTQRIVGGRQPTPGECRDLLTALLRPAGQ